MSNVTLTEDLLINYDEFDKDLNKNKNLLEENKKVFEQIGRIIQELKNLKNETNFLYDRLNNRQTSIIERVRISINAKMKELMPDISNQVAYDEDDMKTASSPSSVEDIEQVGEPGQDENEKMQD